MVAIISGKSVPGAVWDVVWLAFLLDILPACSPRGADPVARSRAAAARPVPASKHHQEKEAAQADTVTGP